MWHCQTPGHCRHERDTVGTAGTPPACLGHDHMLGHCWHGLDTVSTAGTPQRVWDTITRWYTDGMAGTLPAETGLRRYGQDTVDTLGYRWPSQDAVVLAVMPFGQPGRRPAGRDAVGSDGTQLGHPGHRPAGRDTVGSVGTPSGWSKHRWHSQDAVGSAGSPSGWPGHR